MKLNEDAKCGNCPYFRPLQDPNRVDAIGACQGTLPTPMPPDNVGFFPIMLEIMPACSKHPDFFEAVQEETKPTYFGSKK